EQTELVHQLQRRGMDGVAAEIAEEVGVLLEHDDVDAGARQQEAEHEPARPTADDAATRGELLGCHSCSSAMDRDEHTTDRLRTAAVPGCGTTGICREPKPPSSARSRCSR